MDNELTIENIPGVVKSTIQSLHDELDVIFDPERVLYTAALIALVLLATSVLSKVVDWVLHWKRRRGESSRRSPLVRRTPAIRTTVWALGIALALYILFHSSVFAVIILSTPLAFGIGFASRDILQNIIAGVILSFDRTFEEEDTIRIGEHEGEVVSITLRHVTLRNARGHLAEIPNSHFLSHTSSNVTPDTNDAQVKIIMVLPEGTSAAEARSIAYTAASVSRFSSPCTAPEVFVNTEGTEDLLTRLTIRGYVFDPVFEEHYRSDVVELIREGLGIGTDKTSKLSSPEAVPEMAIIV